MNDEQKSEASPRVMSSKMREWHQRFQKMQECKTLDALVVLHGPPHYKVQQQGFEIWHYPLGVESGMLYSIHVSVWPDQSRQAFLYFEPSGIQVSFPRLRSWFRKR
jgi:hypothetical protein